MSDIHNKGLRDVRKPFQIAQTYRNGDEMEGGLLQKGSKAMAQISQNL